MSSFLFSSYLLHFNCKFVALKTKKILSTNHHYGNPSTRFSVEPQLIEFFGQVTKEDLEWRFPSQTFPGTPI